jgi:predicted phage tail protein
MSESEKIVELSISAPDRELFDQADTRLMEARGSWGITKADDYDAAGKSLSVIKGLQKQLEEKRTSITKPLNEALKRVNDFFRQPREALEQAEEIQKKHMLGWREQLAKIARAEQARLDELARKEREAMAARAAEVERKAKEKADAMRAAATNAQEKLAAEKAAAKREDDARIKAEALREQAAQVKAPTVATPVVKSAGQSVRESWSFEVFDVTLLPREYVVADLVKIRAVVNATKGTVPIPGVRITKGETMSSRS